MNVYKINGKILRSEDFNLRSVKEEETGLDVDAPSFLFNLLTLQKKLRMKKLWVGFRYSFPFALNRNRETNGFKATFPLIFE